MNIIVKRFLKVFVFGGIGSMLMQLAQAPSFSTFGDLKPWAISIGVAFLSGGLAALEKGFQTPTN